MPLGRLDDAGGLWNRFTESHFRPDLGVVIRPADADKVLMRWSLDDEQVRVAYGNLSTETGPRED
jgi:hypothetical protein